MFNLQSFATQKSGVSDGNIANALNKIRQLLTKLLHSPETGVIYLTNVDPITTVSFGSIVCPYTDPYSCVAAYADDGPAQPIVSRGFAVCLSDEVAPSEGGYFRFNGEADVHLENDLTPVAGELVYVSKTAYGLGTNVIPGDLNDWVRVVGTIKDASEYSSPSNVFVRMILGKCCESQNLPA